MISSTISSCSAGVGRTGTFIILDRLQQTLSRRDFKLFLQCPNFVISSTISSCSAGVGRTGTFIILDRLQQTLSRRDFKLFLQCPNFVISSTISSCSAGVGRTGTFIILDRLQQTLGRRDFKWENTVDIFDMVIGMRHNRTNMVQTEVRYNKDFFYFTIDSFP